MCAKALAVSDYHHAASTSTQPFSSPMDYALSTVAYRSASPLCTRDGLEFIYFN